MIEKEFDPSKDLIFDLKVREACFSCKRYSFSASCPPYIGTFEYYKKLLRRYKYGRIFIEKFVIENPIKYKEIGKESSLKLHKTLLVERKKLLDDGHFFNILLGGGSCKWCKECKIPCQFPQFRVLPLEATGINVVDTLAKMGYWLKFPVTKIFYRVGGILWN